MKSSISLKSMIKNVCGLLTFSLILFVLSSCTLPPSYSPENIDNILKKICKEEFNLDVGVWKKGETIWIYTPFKNLIDKEGDWDKNVAEDIRKISQALTRVLLNMDSPPRFYSFVISDIEASGLDIYRIGFIPDKIKFEMGLISYKEMLERELYIPVSNPNALGDTEGNHIQKYDIPIEEFIAVLVRQRMESYFKSSDEISNNYLINSFYSDYSSGILYVTFDIALKKDKKNVISILEEIEKIVKELITTYSSFQDINKVLIKDIFNEKSQEIVFNAYKDKSNLTKYSEDKINNNINKNYTSDYHISIGNQHFKVKNYQEAILSYKKGIEINSFNSKGYLGLGNCFYLLNKPDEALINFKKCLEITPDNYEANFRIGYIYLSLEKYNDALRVFNIASKLNPVSFEVYQNKASIYFKLGEYEKSIEHYKKSIDVNPNLPDTYYNLGIIYYDLKNYEESNVNYKKAIDLNPNYFEAYYNLGINYIFHEDYENALKVYLKALDIKPDSIITLEKLGWIYWTLNQYEDVINYFKKILDIESDNSRAFINLGLAYSKLNNIDKARENLLKAKEIFINRNMTDEIKKLDEYLIQLH